MVIRQVAFGSAEFERCFQIRLEVFVKEQKVPLEEERDEYDATALHFLASDGGVDLGTARVLLKEGGRVVKIGRVAVAKAARGLGIGAALIRFVEAEVPGEEYQLDAQMHALRFYEKLGYAAYGPEFLDGGIPHRRMRKVGGVE